MTFLVLQPARYLDESETVEFGEVHVFVGPGLRHHGPPRREPRPRGGPPSARGESRDLLAHGPYAVVWAVCDDIVDQYLPVVAGVENDIDEIEDELFSGDPAVSKRIFGLQREVIDLQHATTPLVSTCSIGSRRSSWRSTGAKEAPAFRDVDDHARRIVEKVDAFRATLDSALTVHATMVEQENNEAMRRMAEFGLAAERAGQEGVGLGGDPVRADARRHDLRHELRLHARAALGVRLPDGARPHGRDERHAVPRLQAQGLAVADVGGRR